MKLITLFLALNLFSFVAIYASGREISDEIDLPAIGWNKVLQVANGNTMIFHFEARKPILVKVFNPDRKEIASEKFIGEVIDVMALERSELHGIYDMGGEAVVFISQSILNNVSLVALRFNTATGRIIKEHTLITSPTYKRRNSYSLVRNPVTGGYAVFCMKDLVANFEEKLQLLVFDDHHNKQQEVTIELDTKEYDDIKHVSTDAGNDGAFVVTLTCKKIVHFPLDIDNYLAVCYLPKDAKAFTNVITKLPAKSAPYYSMYTYSDFGKILNIFLVNATTVVYQRGLQKVSKILYHPVLVMYRADNLADMHYSPLNHTYANKYLKEQTDSAQQLDPVPLKAYTNKYGLHTVIAEENEQKILLDDQLTNYTMIGHIAITQVNDEGKEIWSVVLPKKQFVRNVLTTYDIYTRGVYTQLFRRADPTSDWLYQFVSYKSIMKPNGDCYVIFNDLHSNFDKGLSADIDSMYSGGDEKNYYNTNAVIYKITKKREVSKDYLFDTSSSNFSYAAMIEGSDYNEETGVYATLLIHHDADSHSHKLGWRRLDD